MTGLDKLINLLHELLRQGLHLLGKGAGRIALLHHLHDLLDLRQNGLQLGLCQLALLLV